MSLETRDVDRVYRKLGMKVTDSKDRLARFYHKGKLILLTRRSLGNRKIDGKVRHLIRQQLKLNQTEFSGVVDCTLPGEDYIDILKRKGLICS